MLPVVRRTESQIASNEALNHEYITVTGNEQFTKAAVELLLGEDSPAVKEKRAFGCQSLSGTGALRLGAELLARVMHRTTFYVSIPTWGKRLENLYILYYFFYSNSFVYIYVVKSY